MTITERKQIILDKIEEKEAMLTTTQEELADADAALAEVGVVIDG